MNKIEGGASGPLDCVGTCGIRVSCSTTRSTTMCCSCQRGPPGQVAWLSVAQCLNPPQSIVQSLAFHFVSCCTVTQQVVIFDAGRDDRHAPGIETLAICRAVQSETLAAAAYMFAAEQNPKGISAFVRSREDGHSGIELELGLARKQSTLCWWRQFNDAGRQPGDSGEHQCPVQRSARGDRYRCRER